MNETRGLEELHIYRILFYQERTRYELYAHNLVVDEGMVGFVGIEDILFDTSMNNIIDPAEERLKTEFANIHCFYVPYHNVIRIDEVKRRGKTKIVDQARKATGNVVYPSAFNPSENP